MSTSIPEADAQHLVARSAVRPPKRVAGRMRGVWRSMT